MVHIQQLHRLLFAIVRSTTIALPAWHRHCEAHKIKPRVLPCNVVTRWNSTLDMLNFAVQYWAVIDAMTADKSLKPHKFELETEEWTIVKDLVTVLLVSICVMSSSSYSSSSEVKAGNSEVWRVPGNGFSSCAAPTFSHVQGISNRGQNGFPDCVGTEICTRTIPNTRVRARGTEVRSSCGSEVRRMRGIELS